MVITSMTKSRDRSSEAGSIDRSCVSHPKWRLKKDQF